MSVDPANAAKLLSTLYVEREEGQWKSVANCLEELMDGKIIQNSELTVVALNLAERGSSFHDEIIRRARKINNRVGQPGLLEVQMLAKASIDLALSGNGYEKLAAHVSRIGFNRKNGQELDELVARASARTRTSIDNLSRSVKSFSAIEDPLSFDQLQQALKERDEYIHNEFWSRDRIHAEILACIAGQSNSWEAVDLLLGHHKFPYPYEYELIATQACFSVAAVEGQVTLTKMPALPNKLQVSDTVNFPLLSFVTSSQYGEAAPKHAATTKVPLTDFARQLLLEVIFRRVGAN